MASISYSGLKEVVRYDKKDDRITKSFRFWTRQYFKVWRSQFYQDSRKIFPKDLNNWITPLAIAVWYMDDGCYQKFDCTLSTESFDSETKEKLIKQLKGFGVEAILRGRGKLRIRSKSLPKFFELIGPYMHSSMAYKLP